MVENTSKRIAIATFSILLLAAVAGTYCVLPYATTLLKQPLTTELILKNIASGAVVMSVVIGLGLFVASKVNLGAPLIVGLSNRTDVRPILKPILYKSISMGFLAGAVIVAIQLVMAGGKINAAAMPPLWQGFLASFYGGINEELQCRLLIMSCITWVAMRLRKEKPNPSISTFWIANVLTAILFGAAHLPAAAHLAPLTVSTVLSVIVANSFCGIVFGYFYFTRGLEAAMASHFAADISLHVLPPLFCGSWS